MKVQILIVQAIAVLLFPEWDALDERDRSTEAWAHCVWHHHSTGTWCRCLWRRGETDGFIEQTLRRKRRCSVYSMVWWHGGGGGGGGGSGVFICLSVFLSVCICVSLLLCVYVCVCVCVCVFSKFSIPVITAEQSNASFGNIDHFMIKGSSLTSIDVE